MDCLQKIDINDMMKRARIAVDQIVELGYALRSREKEIQLKIYNGEAQVHGGIIPGLGVSKYKGCLHSKDQSRLLEIH